MKTLVAFSCITIFAPTLIGCSDPPPSANALESPQSIYSVDLISQPRASAQQPLLIQPDEQLTCSMSGKSISATVSWNATASGATGVQIYVRHPSESATQAKLWTSGATIGLLKTPSWVVPGMTFELRDSANQKVITRGTLACI